jgi:integrase
VPESAIRGHHLAFGDQLGGWYRIGELLQAECKNVDLENHTRFIPSENFKGTRRKKQDHHVFLSPQILLTAFRKNNALLHFAFQPAGLGQSRVGANSQ